LHASSTDNVPGISEALRSSVEDITRQADGKISVSPGNVEGQFSGSETSFV